jgi:dihydroxyacetone kinase
MNLQNLRKALKIVSEIMIAQKDYLVELDQKNGDGDLGISMAAGFKAVSDYLDSTEVKDLGRIFMKCSSVFNEAAPSSLGTIMSVYMMGMAKSLKGKEEVDLSDLVTAMDVGLTTIMEKAKSKPGEKTILDSFYPAVEALKKYAASGDWYVAFGTAAKAAAEGSENTRNMKSVHGRAAYYGDKSIGILDGGSVVGKLIFEGLNKYLLSLASTHKDL